MDNTVRAFHSEVDPLDTGRSTEAVSQRCRRVVAWQTYPWWSKNKFHFAAYTDFQVF